VVGKFGAIVEPVTYAAPSASIAIALAASKLYPPRYVAHPPTVVSVGIFATNASDWLRSARAS